MGVYVFRWRHGPWLKLGHYCLGNPWCRIARRGWASVAVPDPLLHGARPADFDLLYWSPRLSRRDEAAVRRRFHATRFGEWVPSGEGQRLVAELAALDPGDDPAGTTLEQALASRRRA